ncbi:phosphatidylinositol-3-phosphatase ymr1, partial [Linderina macrospora]
MGVGKEETGKHWRFTNVNMGYQLCSTYPPVLVVPARISDTTLTYAARYRSKGRLPVLCYLHGNKASMTRSSQPMVGLKQARSVQDEKLVEAIIASSEQDGVAPRFDNERKNIIIDARPTTNAVVNRAVGAGSENMDHYRRCRKVYLGIDNIHVMRDALNKLVDAIQSDDNVDRGVVARIQKSSKTNWLKHIENIMVGVKTIVEAIDQGRHVVVHCSDGWDRTAQLTSLAQLCLDPYYRTIEGFAVLVEKEWVSFGHQFSLRCGHTGHPERFKVTRAANRRRPKEPLDDDAADSSSSPAAVDNSDAESSVENSAVGTENGGAEAGSGFDFVQTTSSMFGRFATRAFKTVQSRVSSAIQAASDNLDDAAMDDPDPFYTDYPDLQPNYVPPRSSSLSDGEAKSTGGFRLVRSKHDHETSPVFHQFLDCVFQLCVQHPTMFEFNERFLLDLFYHLYSAQFGSFLGNNARERADGDFYAKSHSIWSWVGQKMNETDEEGSDGVYRNDLYNEDTAGEERTKVILPDTAYIQYWSALFSCHDPALADREETTTAIATETTATATTFREEAEDEESAKAAETAAKEEKQGAEAAET